MHCQRLTTLHLRDCHIPFSVTDESKSAPQQFPRLIELTCWRLHPTNLLAVVAALGVCPLLEVAILGVLHPAPAQTFVAVCSVAAATLPRLRFLDLGRQNDGDNETRSLWASDDDADLIRPFDTLATPAQVEVSFAAICRFIATRQPSAGGGDGGGGGHDDMVAASAAAAAAAMIGKSAVGDNAIETRS
jgi:hypothetical protein